LGCHTCRLASSRCDHRNALSPYGSSAVDRCRSPLIAIAVRQQAKDQGHEDRAREGTTPPRDDDERAVPAGAPLLFRARPGPGDPEAQSAPVHGRGPQRAMLAVAVPRRGRVAAIPAGAYDNVPKSKRPIVLGRIRFPAHGTMTLETNSFERAIEGARFLAPRL